MMDIKGDIAKRFMMRGKFVVIAKMLFNNEDIFTFRISDKCTQKDYYSNDRYYTLEDCERAAVKVCKGV